MNLRRALPILILIQLTVTGCTGALSSWLGTPAKFGKVITNATSPNIAEVVLNVPSDEWSITQSPTLSWNAATQGDAAIAGYQIAIGTAAGLSDVQGWTNIGNVSSVQISGLTLSRGTTYYPSLRAVDTAGLYSDAARGSGWLVNQEQWVTNGKVSAILKTGSKIFIGGEFTQVGPYSGTVVPIKLTDGTLNWPNTANRARVNGWVRTSVPDGSGGVYIAGTFSKVGSLARKNIAHILVDGSVDPAFNVSTDAQINSIFLSGSTLYLAGEFNKVNNVARSYLGAVSTTDGSLVTAFAPVVSGTVATVLVSGSNVYFGGFFTTVGGASHVNLAAVSTATGAVVSGFTASTNGYVFTLGTVGTDLVVGGSFTQINGAARTNLGKVTLAAGASVAFTPNPDGTVRTLLVSGSALYVGGDFFNIAGEYHAYIAALNAVTGVAVTAFAAEPTDVVQALAISGTTLYAGGRFTEITGEERFRVATLSTTDGSVLPNFSPYINGEIYTLSISGSNLFAGGALTAVGGAYCSNFAAISSVTGEAITGFTPTISGVVRALALSPSGSTLYLGGDFGYAISDVRNRVAAMSTNDGTLITAFNPNVNGQVNALATYGNNVFIGGTFTTVGGTSQTNLAGVSSTTGALLPGFFPAGLNSTVVNALAVSGSTLYAGGFFDSVVGQGPAQLSALSAVTGQLMPAFLPIVHGQVNAIAVSGSTVYFGGKMQRISNTGTNYAGAVNATTGAYTAFDPALDYDVNVIAVNGSKVFIGGAFNFVGGVQNPFLAQVSATTGALQTTFANGFDNGSPSALFATDTTLYVGGDFPSINGGPSYYAPVSISTGTALPSY